MREMSVLREVAGWPVARRLLAGQAGCVYSYRYRSASGIMAGGGCTGNIIKRSNHEFPDTLLA